MSDNPRVWVLWRRRKGDLDQMLALLSALGWSAEIKHLDFRMPEIPLLAPLLLKSNSDDLSPPWPDIVLCAEALPSMIAHRLKRRSGGTIKTVAIGRPAGATDKFDLVITTAQFRIPPAANVVELAMPLPALKPEEPDTPYRFEGLRPLIALVVGGEAFPDRLNSKVAGNMALQLRHYAEARGGTLAVVTSPRTQAEVTQTIADAMASPHRVHVFSSGESNYRPLLAAADEIVVTSDSVSMVSDAFDAGKPVSIYPLPRNLSLQWQVTEWLYHHAVEREMTWLRPVRWAFEAGVIETVADRRLLFNALIGEGQINWFGKPLRTPKPGAGREDLQRAAESLRALELQRP